MSQNEEPACVPIFQEILYQYPLHRISYCADDKGEKKFFSFIAKEADKEVHSCFVFVSNKLVSRPSAGVLKCLANRSTFCRRTAIYIVALHRSENSQTCRSSNLACSLMIFPEKSRTLFRRKVRTATSAIVRYGLHENNAWNGEMQAN